MTFSINIDSAKIKEVYNTSVDFMLSSDLFSNDCLLYYPPIQVECTNCNGDFRCLECNGAGYIEQETTETVRLRVYGGNSSRFNKQSLRKLGLNIDNPSGEIFTLGYIKDTPKLNGCNYIVFFNNQEFGRWKYIMSGEPMPYGFGRDEFVATFWNKQENI